MIEPVGAESRPPAQEPGRGGPSGRALVAIVLAAVVLSGLVAGGVTYGVARLQSRTNPQELSLGSRVQLTEESAAAQVVAKAQPAVVTVLTDDRGQSYGSGFLLTTDGFVATSVSTVAGAGALGVLVPGDAKRHDARLVDYDCALGVAVLKVDGVANLPTLNMADSTQVKIGNTVVALGGPYGDTVATKGIVSAVHRSIPVGGSVPRAPDFYPDAIESDTRTDAANSGGPLLNVGGQVVGMNVNVGPLGHPAYALASSSFQPVVERIAQAGRLEVAVIGVEALDLAPDQAAVRGLPVGSLVITVEAGSAADAAGIKAGDVITQVDDHRLDSAHPLLPLLRARYKPAQRAVVSYSRSGSASQVELTLRAGRPVCH